MESCRHRDLYKSRTDNIYKRETLSLSLFPSRELMDACLPQRNYRAARLVYICPEVSTAAITMSKEHTHSRGLTYMHLLFMLALKDLLTTPQPRTQLLQLISHFIYIFFSSLHTKEKLLKEEKRRRRE